MNTPKTTAKDFFLWAGAMVAFYWSVIAYTALLFDYINYALRGPLAYGDPYQSGISLEMASVIVLLPIFVLLMWLIHRDAVADPSKNEIWVRRWALIFTLFLSGVAMAADLITFLTYFLNGSDLTTTFLLKVAVILLIAAGVFMHFISELRGYWDRFPARRGYVRWGVGVLAVVTIISGFFIVGTPAVARAMRLDAERVTALQNIQYRVTDYYQAKQVLPSSIAQLANSLNYGPMPTDPQTNSSYEYSPTGSLTFKLCATFSSAGATSQNTIGDMAAPSVAVGDTAVLEPGDGSSNNDWSHAAGHVCFTRTIDPSFYPPLNKAVMQ